jgi:four helix bundle protein
MKTHKELDVWRRSIDLAKEVYQITRRFPRDEQFGLVTQMRRSTVSIASNIAEGAARRGTKEFIQFLYVAVGSASELDTQLEIAKAIGATPPEELQPVQDSVVRVTMMLRGLIRSLKSSSSPNVI